VDDKKLFAVIIAGGRGTRFWPLSRNTRPKHLLAITGGFPLLRQTLDRILPLVGAERVLVVTTKDQAAEVKSLVADVPPGNILVEPAGRNTAPAIALAAAHVLDRAEDAVMVVLPADHIVSPDKNFLSDLRDGAELARSSGRFVTLGVRPTRPETGYGYIEVGEKLGKKAFAIASFNEKPNRKKARDYIGSGRYLWNSGMFVFPAGRLMEKIKTHVPALYTAWETYRSGGRTPQDVEKFYSGLEPASIDFAIMEKCAADSAVLNASFEWSDVGSWEAIDELWAADASGNRSNDCVVVALASKGNTVVSRKLVALLGVENLIVVETNDAILVCAKDRAQEIKSLVGEMERRGLDEYL
jgi:mannose-1-phosphate guanylyltransferase